MSVWVTGKNTMSPDPKSRILGIQVHCKIHRVFDAIGIKALRFSGNILASCKLPGLILAY